MIIIYMLSIILVSHNTIYHTILGKEECHGLLGKTVNQGKISIDSHIIIKAYSLLMGLGEEKVL